LSNIDLLFSRYFCRWYIDILFWKKMEVLSCEGFATSGSILVDKKQPLNIQNILQ